MIYYKATKYLLLILMGFELRNNNKQDKWKTTYHQLTSINLR